MSDRRPAEMSVVIAADRYDTIRRTIRHVRAQSVRDRLELVVLTPSAKTLELDGADVAGFAGHQVVEVPTIPLALALAAGVRRAVAPIVALAKSHAYPGPGWAEALIKAREGPWTGVAPVIGNANPASLTSWANLFLDYGGCVEPISVGAVDYLPGHNSSTSR